MDQQRTNRAPLFIAIAVLLLSAVYFGSYVALVEPGGIYVVCLSGRPKVRWFVGNYRADQRIAGIVFWPLEQLDRAVRPGAWNSDYDQRLPPRPGQC